MFNEYDTSSPLSYSFSHKMSEIRELFRDNLLGGLVNCFHRMTDLMNTPRVPFSAKIAPNGEPFSKVVFFDFNSLYLYCQELAFPTTPGILWSPIRKCTFRKQLMTSGNSLAALQWLTYIDQHHPSLTGTDGKRVRLEHQYFRGEYKIGGFSIDGHAYVDGVDIFFEFLGCC